MLSSQVACSSWASGSPTARRVLLGSFWDHMVSAEPQPAMRDGRRARVTNLDVGSYAKKCVLGCRLRLMKNPNGSSGEALACSEIPTTAGGACATVRVLTSSESAGCFVEWPATTQPRCLSHCKAHDTSASFGRNIARRYFRQC